MSCGQKEWEQQFLKKIYEKRLKTIDSVKSLYPYTTKNGRYDAVSPARFNWTCGFWGGIQWLLYEYGKDEHFLQRAKVCTDDVAKALSEFLTLSHDLGFQFLPTTVKGYAMTGNERYKTVSLYAANLLAGRFNPNGRFIRAWDEGNGTYQGLTSGLAIIDCMMNLPLLYWAGREMEDTRFAQIANAHADTVIKEFVRKEGSVNHIVIFNPETGEVIDKPQGQGYAKGSSWTRGQAWAIYGFADAYKNTGKKEYLDTALKVAKYFIGEMEERLIPPIDFKQPTEVDYCDTTAGTIAAAGMTILKEYAESDAEILEKMICRLLEGAYQNCSFDTEEDSVLQNGSEMYHTKTGIKIPIIYGDYYLIEALMLRNSGLSII